MEDVAADYWCIVAVDYLRHCGFIVAESEDCVDDDLLVDSHDVADIFGMDWAKPDKPPGLYRLELAFDEDENAVNVESTELLTAFPPLPEKQPNYVHITKSVIRDEP